MTNGETFAKALLIKDKELIDNEPNPKPTDLTKDLLLL